MYYPCFSYICIGQSALSDFTGFHTLRPGELLNVSFSLLSVGDNSTFNLKANALSNTGVGDLFGVDVSPSSATVGEFSPLFGDLQIRLDEDAAIAEGSVVTFVLTAENEENQYAFTSFSMTVTNMPLPQFAENVSGLSLGWFSVCFRLSLLVVINCW